MFVPGQVVVKSQINASSPLAWSAQIHEERSLPLSSAAPRRFRNWYAKQADFLISGWFNLILAHTASPPPLPLPSGWVDAVEVNDDAVLHLTDWEAVAAAENKHVMLAEIHTVGDWMIRLKLETIMLETGQEEFQLWKHLLEVPAIPFRLKAGGLGAINSTNVVRGTVCAPSDGIAETALAADLSPSIRR